MLIYWFLDVMNNILSECILVFFLYWKRFCFSFRFVKGNDEYNSKYLEKKFKKIN